MALYTDKNLSFEPKLIDKVDLMIKRCIGEQKKDNLLIVEGDEGDGKSNLSMGIAYYVSWKTGRKFDVENVFFDVEKMTKFAIENEEQIIVWDEPALAALSNDWYKEEQKNLIKMLMMARKRRHFFIFNITKFYKFSEYIVVDRSVGMVHVYSKNQMNAGHFVYYKKRNKELLYYAYRTKKKREYKLFYNFRGTFGEYLPKVIDEKVYEQKKDEAIASILTSKSKKKLVNYSDRDFDVLRYKFAKLYTFLRINPKPTQDELCEWFGIPMRRIQEWRDIDLTKWEKHLKSIQD